MDRLEILPSARRHGIEDERMLHVVRTCLMPLAHRDETGQVLFLGFDPRGVPLEVVAFLDDAGDLTIFHAMRMRRGYRAMFREMLR